MDIPGTTLAEHIIKDSTFVYPVSIIICHVPISILIMYPDHWPLVVISTQ